MEVYCSIVLSTYNKDRELRNTLRSIFAQAPSFPFEVIVVDDGSTDKTEFVCENFRSYGCIIRYRKLDRPEYQNPGFARNIGYKMARGKVVIAQSDEVIHGDLEVIERLMSFEPRTFNIAHVQNATVDDNGKVQQKHELYTGPSYPRPLFFLGSLLREDIYKIGGNCEEFTEPGYEDDWFGQCLSNGLQKSAVFRMDVTGFHQKHRRPSVVTSYANMKALFEKKYQEASEGKAEWVGGPAWEFTEST